MRFLVLSALLTILAQGETGRVEVVVRDATTKKLLVGIPVTLTYRFPNEPAGLSSTVLTDPRGEAQFSGLVTGRYLITSETFVSLRTEDSIVVLPTTFAAIRSFRNNSGRLAADYTDGNPS